VSLQIIINADDLGLCDSVNEAIFGLLERKRITSATLMANAPATEMATRDAKHFPDGTFGVHLNATSFAPLTSSPAMRPLLSENGEFRRDIHQIRLGNDTLAALQAEFIAQIKRLQQLGVHVSHIDSHHHVHTIPALFLVLKAVQKHFGIRRVRNTMNLYPLDAPADRVLLASKWLWGVALRKWYGTHTTRWFAPFSVFHARRTEFAGRSTTMELMVHTGEERYAAENRLLNSDWQRDLSPGLELNRYADL